MKRRFPPAVCTLALWLLAFSTAICAEQVAPSGYPSMDPFENLQRALRTERETRARTGGTSGSGREMYESRSYLDGIRQAMNRGEDTSALNALNQLEAMATTEEVRRACEALADKINKDRAAREEVFNTEVEVAVKRAGELVLKAKEPKELDGQIEDFNRLLEARSSQYSDGRESRSLQKLQGAVAFLCSWQEYLAATTKGDEQNAGSILRNLTSNNSGRSTLLIPRSEILARQSGDGRRDGSSRRGASSPGDREDALTAILSGLHSLADVPDALAKLEGLQREINGNGSYSSEYGADLRAAITNLQNLQKTQSELQAGLATTISLTVLRADGNTRMAVESKLTGLRAELLKLALPRLLGVPDEKPAADERVAEFLRRLIEIDKKQGNWALVARGLEIQRSFAASQNGNNAANTQEAEAFKSFFTGLNMESAGQYEQAAIAFLTALKSGVQDLPAATIGERLAAIEKAHPKEFTEANTYILNPPAPTYPNSPYGPRGPYDPRFNRPGFPQQNLPEQPTPPTAVAVPAVTSSPAPSSPPISTPTPAPKPSA